MHCSENESQLDGKERGGKLKEQWMKLKDRNSSIKSKQLYVEKPSWLG